MTAGRRINANKKDWCTPPKYVDAIRNFFGEIELDPCSNKQSIVNAKVEYIYPKNDGLVDTWNFKTVYVNPPYGIDKENNTSIKDWIKRCDEANQEHESEVLALIPVAVNTRHWKEHVFGKANSVCFLADTRLKFINGTNDKGAPMACAMVYWGNKGSKFYKKFSKFGAVIDLTSLKKNKWVSPDLKKDQTLLQLHL